MAGIGHEILRDSQDSRQGLKVYDNNSMGYYGGVFIDDLIEHTPTTPRVFVAIKFTQDTQFTALTGNITGDFTGVTFEKGDNLVGRFTSITLASGSVIAYEGV